MTLLTKDMTRPNGIAFSPDEKTLYVAQSDPEDAIWMAFDVKPDGTLGKGRKFFDVTDWVKEGKKGLPDGMKVDAAGNLFATGPGGVHIFAPDGTHLGTFETGEATAIAPGATTAARFTSTPTCTWCESSSAPREPVGDRSRVTGQVFPPRYCTSKGIEIVLVSICFWTGLNSSTSKGRPMELPARSSSVVSATS